MSKKLVIANWKMNPQSLKEAVSLFTSVKNFSKKYSSSVVLCPPFPFLSALSEKAQKGGGKVALGAQDLFFEKEGPYTGEVSASMLVSCKVSYVIVGHSERRKLGEENALIGKKVAAALSKKITPILCIGEKERDNDGAFFHILRDELISSLVLVAKKDIAKVIIAYEPVWAISTSGRGAMDPHAICETIIYLRKVLSDKFGKEAAKVKIIYGGSVDERDVRDILSVSGADGALVGKASLKTATFEKILKALSD